MAKVIAVLATLDTKGQEAEFLRKQLKALGSRALVVDMGVLGAPAARADVTRAEVARAGGATLTALRRDPTREASQPVMAAGATKLLLQRLATGRLHGVMGLGGLQGTATGTMVMRALPYGLPKVMVSTVASGDTSPYVGISDITMMFSVGDILGLNAFMRKVLANAAGAAHGMAQVKVELVRKRRKGDKPLVGISNLGVLTQGTLHAQALLAARGYEALVFHAVGTGGRAMELMMRQGIIGAVFDYAMGEISDEIFHGLRAGGAGAAHGGGHAGTPAGAGAGRRRAPGHPGVDAARAAATLEDPQTRVAQRGRARPAAEPRELRQVAREAGRRLQTTRGNAVLMLPLLGTGRYAMPGGPLNDPEGDAIFFAELKAHMPPGIEVVERAAHAEDPGFVAEAVDRLIALIERR